MKDTNIKEILDDPMKKIIESENLLTRLFRTILFDLNIGGRRFDALVKRYLMDPNSGIKDDKTARNNHRGNLMKELAAADMTWRVFMKALRVVGAVEFEVVVNMRHMVDGKLVLTSHVVKAENAITYDEPKTDLSNAKVIDHFLSDELSRQSEENTIPAPHPERGYISEKVAEKLIIPSAAKE